MKTVICIVCLEQAAAMAYLSGPASLPFVFYDSICNLYPKFLIYYSSCRKEMAEFVAFFIYPGVGVQMPLSLSTQLSRPILSGFVY